MRIFAILLNKGISHPHPHPHPHSHPKCPDGGIGRRAGLKNQWDFSLAGSIPAPGTAESLDLIKDEGFIVYGDTNQ